MLLPWARHYAGKLAAVHGVPFRDTWDEAVTALVRAAVYFRPGAGSFARYAQRAVVRGCWRYCARTAMRRPTVGLEETAAEGLVDGALIVPSAEAEYAARELVGAHGVPTDQPPRRVTGAVR